jgi:CheY-like chemotaxis protein
MRMTALSDKTVLVVDDEQDLREMVAFEFEMRGAKIFSVNNGLSALGIVETEPIDAIVTDIRMAGCDGIELLNNLRAKSLFSPVVIFITAYDSDLPPCDAYRMGAEGIFAKPFSLKELVSKVEHALIPPEKRWSAPPQFPPVHLIEHHWPDLESPRRAGWFECGRGGVAIMAKQRGLTPGEAVAFNIRVDLGPVRTIEGSGTVRWAKQGADHQSTFCGVEFDYLSGSCRVEVIRWINSTTQRSFIPGLRSSSNQ